MKNKNKYFRKILILVFLLGAVTVYGQNNQEKKDLIGRSPADSTRISSFRDNHIGLTGQELADADFPKSWPLFGSKARLSFGGYVKLDYIQDFNGVHNDRYELSTVNVHVDNSGVVKEQGYMNLFARESRFNFDFRTKTEKGKPLRVFLEMDFWNLDRDPFHNTPRLRHFYAVYNNWLVGRSWGTLTDGYSVPNSIDFQAGDAITGSRRAQIRYENKLAKTMKWAVAAEMLEYPDIDGNGFDGENSMLLPVLVARITKATKLDGRMMFGGSVYQLRWDGLEVGPNVTAIGWGIAFSGRQNFTKKFSMQWNLSGGDGWATNIIAFTGGGQSAIINPQGELEPLFTWSLSGALIYNFSPVLDMNVMGAWLDVEESMYKSENSYSSGATGHINLIYSPVKSVNVGIEYGIGQRVNIDGKSGIANRVQMMCKYIF